MSPGASYSGGDGTPVEALVTRLRAAIVYVPLSPKIPMPSEKMTRASALHIARLARLAIDDEELERVANELGTILEYVAQLDEVDTSGVEAVDSVFLEKMPLRPDVVAPGIAHDDALADAPRVAGGGFVVPGFVDE